MTEYSSSGFGGRIDWGTDEVESASGLAIPTFNSAGVPTVLLAGTALQSLRVNSAGTGLEFGGSGVIQLIEHKTLSSTASPVAFTTGITGFQYLLLLLDLSGGATSSGTIGLRFNNDSGANYSYNQVTGTTITQTSGATQTVMGFTLQTSNGVMTGALISVNARGSGNFHGVSGLGGSLQNITLGGTYASASAITEVDLVYSGTGGANTLTGNATLYGIAIS